MLWLSQKDVLSSGITDMGKAVAQVRETLKLQAQGQTISAQEIPLRLRETGTDEAFYSLPAFVGGGVNKAGIKWTTHHPDNKEKNLPHIYTTLLLNDPSTGLPLAALEGSVISAMRTGAVSAVAFQELANPDSRALFCGGAGVQARQQIRGALYALPKLEKVDIFCRTLAHGEKLAQELREEYPNCHFTAVSEPPQMGYDVIIGATNSPEPYLKAEHFGAGCFYCHIGLRDVTSEAIDCFDHIVLDDFQAGVAHSGQSIFVKHRQGTLDEGKLSGLLSQYVTRECALERDGQKRLMFDGFGMVIFDIALGAWVYSYAKERGLGQEMPLWDNTPIWR